MRFLLLPILAVSLIVSSQAARSADDPVPAAKFKGTADLPDAVQIATGFSEDKQAVTVLFRNLYAVVGGPKGSLVNTRTATVTLPIDNKEKEIRASFDVRGFVSVHGKARAALIVQAAGKTTVIDLKKDRTKEPEKGEAVKQAKERAKAQLKDTPTPDKPAQAYDFSHRIEGTIPAGGNCQVTFFLLTERDAEADEMSSYLAVDSLDVETAKPTPAKK